MLELMLHFVLIRASGPAGHGVTELFGFRALTTDRIRVFYVRSSLRTGF
jgi:hypothetical protein